MIYDKKFNLLNHLSFSFSHTDSGKLTIYAKEPIDLPPIVSVELIQITDKTSIPYAPKAKK